MALNRDVLNSDQSKAIDEMSIVDIFTKLIFDVESELATSEKTIVDLLLGFDHLSVNASRRDVAEYLQSMPIDEMIALVQKIKACLDHGHASDKASSFLLRTTPLTDR